MELTQLLSLVPGEQVVGSLAVDSKDGLTKCIIQITKVAIVVHVLHGARPIERFDEVIVAADVLWELLYEHLSERHAHFFLAVASTLLRYLDLAELHVRWLTHELNLIV